MKIKFQETINPDLGITILKAGLKFQVQCCYSNNIEKEYIVENKKNCLFNLKNIIYGDVIKKIKDLQYDVYCYKKNVSNPSEIKLINNILSQFEEIMQSIEIKECNE